MTLDDFSTPPALGDGRGETPARAPDAVERVVDPRPTITLAGTLQEQAHEVLVAIARHNDPPHLYLRDRQVLRVVTTPESTYLDALDKTSLRVHLSERFRVQAWRRIKPADKERPDENASAAPASDDGQYKLVPVDLPLTVTEYLLQCDGLDFPPLDAVSSMPVFTPQGRLVTASGYQRGCRAHFDLRRAPALGDASPSAQDVADAKHLIFDELLVDFPFADDAARAHAVGLGLLPLVRHLIPDPSPQHLISATSEGSGKTILARGLTWISTGVLPRVIATPRDDDEFGKRVFTALLEAPPAILIDNVGKRLDSPMLASVLTSNHWTDRILGLSKSAKVSARCAWIATGNNISLSRELARRTVAVRLAPPVEKPWLRTSFRHQHFEEWVRANQPILLAAFVTIVQRWIDAGMPPGRQVLGSYEAWSRVIGGILEVAEIPGFLERLDGFYEELDDESERWAVFIGSWFRAHGHREVPVKDLHQLAADAEIVAYPPGHAKEHSARVALGSALRRRNGRIFGSLMLSKARTDGHTKVTAWQLVPAGTAGCGKVVPARDHAAVNESTSDSGELAGTAGTQSLPPHMRACMREEEILSHVGREVDTADPAIQSGSAENSAGTLRGLAGDSARGERVTI